MNLAATIALILTAGALGTASGSAIPQPGHRANAVVVKFDAFNRHDVAAIRASYAFDAVLHSPDYPVLRGSASIAETYQHLFDAMPDAKDSVQSLGYFKDKVYAQFLLTGHVKGAANAAVSIRIVSIYTIRDGLIIEDDTYYDRKAP